MTEIVNTPLTDFEEDCVFLYASWDSDPFNLKIIGKEVKSDEDWKTGEVMEAKYQSKSINDILSGVKVTSKKHFEKWFAERKGNGTIWMTNGKWYKRNITVLGEILLKHNTTTDKIIEGISSAIKKNIVTQDVVVFRGLNMNSIQDFSQSSLGFSSFTSDINVILENTEDYLNPNGCCILRTVLKKGIHAYYHPHEEQYILDKDIKFSMPKSVTKPVSGNYLIYDIDILHFSGGRALEKSGMKQQNPNKQIRKIVKKYRSVKKLNRKRSKSYKSRRSKYNKSRRSKKSRKI